MVIRRNGNLSLAANKRHPHQSGEIRYAAQHLAQVQLTSCVNC